MPLDAAVKTVEREGMERNCNGLILAVSGGPDSMAMLRWYAERKPPFPLYVAHVHHGLRPESDGEAKTVVDYCNTLAIPCHVFRTNVKSEMRKGETVESAARRLRYGFFRALAEETGATHLATAHTRDDQCETVLLHLLHGAGPKGLCGMFPMRKEGDLTLIRPLIDCSKEELLSYCIECRVPYAFDSSNDDLTYTRNRIRHILLPEMEKINPNVRQAVCRTASALQAQQRAFEERAIRFLAAHPEGIPAAELRSLPEGEQIEILRKAFESLGKSLSAEQTEQAAALLKKETGTVEFDRKYVLHLGQNLLTVCQKAEPVPELRITEERTVLPDGTVLHLQKTLANKDNRTQLIPARLPLILRSRKEGDTIRTPGGTKTLKKRMIELRIPQYKRDRLRVLSDGKNVLWCESLGINPQNSPKETEEGYFVSLSEK